MALRALLSVLVAVAASGGVARADTIWLNEQGIESLEEIEAGITPARTFRSGDKVCIRGTIEEVEGRAPAYAEPAPPDGIAFQVLAWWRPTPAAKLEVADQTFRVPVRWVERIDQEVDSLLDLRLLLSDRDVVTGGMFRREADGAVIRFVPNPDWLGRLNAALDPGGRLRLASGVAGQETDEERAELFHYGSLLYFLDGESLSGPGARDAYLDPFHPLRVHMSADAAVAKLIAAIVRNRSHYDHDEVPLERRAEYVQFRKGCALVAGLLCRFAKVRPNGGEPTTQARAERLHSMGLRARFGVIQLLEAAAAGHLRLEDITQPGIRDALGASVRRIEDERAREAELAKLRAMTDNLRGLTDTGLPGLPSAAVLPTSPTAVAVEALKLIREEPSWWADHRTHPGTTSDLPRLTRALVAMGRRHQDERGEPLPDARLADEGAFGPSAVTGGALLQAPGDWTPAQLEARQTLTQLLRPLRAHPDLEGAPHRESVERASAILRREADALLVSGDTGARECVQQVMVEAGFGDLLVTQRAVHGLFATATAADRRTADTGSGDGTSSDYGATSAQLAEGARREVLRARRRHALTTLLLLGSLDASSSAEARAVVDMVDERFEETFVRMARGEASAGERGVVQMLGRLSQREDEGTLDERARDMRERQLARARAAFDEARANLRRLAAGQAPSVSPERLRAEVTEIKRRLEATTRAWGGGEPSGGDDSPWGN